jgi:hypothetical protein
VTRAADVLQQLHRIIVDGVSARAVSVGDLMVPLDVPATPANEVPFLIPRELISCCLYSRRRMSDALICLGQVSLRPLLRALDPANIIAFVGGAT